MHYVIENFPEISFVTWLESFISQAPVEAVELCSSTLPGIWWVRNKKCFHDIQTPIYVTMEKACALLFEYQKGSMESQIHRVTSLPPWQGTWKAPPENCYKLNTDVTMNGEGECGNGAIIKDWDGNTMGAATWKLRCMEDLTLAEAIGIKLGMKFAIKLLFLNRQTRSMWFWASSKKMGRFQCRLLLLFKL